MGERGVKKERGADKPFWTMDGCCMKKHCCLEGLQQFPVYITAIIPSCLNQSSW